MNRVVVSLYLGCAMLLFAALGATGVAYAQDQTAAGTASSLFAPVPTDHWAYQAVDTLQKAAVNATGSTLDGHPAGSIGLLSLFKSRGLALNSEFTQTAPGLTNPLGQSDSYRFNQAWKATLRAAFGSLSLSGGYADFYAPGDLLRDGNSIDPVNVKGPIVSASLAISRQLVLAANGHFYQGAETSPAQNNGADILQNPLSNTTERINHYDVGLKYGFTSQYTLDLGYEWDQWVLNDFANSTLGTSAGRPTEQYFTIGVGHSFNKNASLKLLYQVLDYDDQGTGFDPYSEEPGLNGKEHSGVAVTQFSIEF